MSEGDNKDLNINVSVDSPELDKAAGELVRNLLGPTARQAGGILGNEFGYWKLRHAFWISDRVNKLLEQRGIATGRKYLSEQQTMRLIETAAYVEDDVLKEKWARLVANAQDPGQSVELRPMYMNILSNLTPLDALVLEKIAELPPENDFHGVWTDDLPKRARPAGTPEANLDLMLDEPEGGNPSPEVGHSLSTLIGLGCILPNAGFGGPLNIALVRLTPLGRAFAEACKP